MIDITNINMLDIMLGATVFIGAIFGFFLGFIRSGLFVASWAGAGFTTLYGLPVIRPFAREYVSEVFYADLLAGFSLFIAALILFFLASSIIASWIRNSRLNALDRSLGLLAGLSTSIVVLSLSVLVMDKLLKNKNYPPFIKTSKSVPAIRIFSHMLNEKLPKQIGEWLDPNLARDQIEKTRKNVENKVFDRLINPEDQSINIEQRQGYGIKERKALEKAIDRLNQLAQ